VSDAKAYSYAVVRIVPRVERDEFINAGVIVFSAELRFLDAVVRMNEDRLRALWPEIDLKLIRRHLEAIPRICAGAPGAGPIAKLGKKERFHWLTAPRSTMIQISPVRIGLTEEPGQTLARLADDLVS
jgi:hypothetical protein